MFYSNEILTSRKYGVATVWLVATLGSKSNLKKINRKAILDVDVPKACETIVDPQAPMALRLQSSLLYGVSRVYSQQCGYVLSDVQHAHNSMRFMLSVVKTAGLDPEAGKARPDQLILQDDPSFLPEFALPPFDPGFLDFDLPSQSLPSQSSVILSLPSSRPPSQHHAHTPEAQVGGLIIPHSSSTGGGGMAGIDMYGDEGVGVLAEEEPQPLPDAEFELDEEGNLLEITPSRASARTPTVHDGMMIECDAAASARVRREHEEAQRHDGQGFDDQMDLDLPILGEELPEGEAFHTGIEDQPLEQPSSARVEEIESVSTAEAPMRRKKRVPRVLPVDDTAELRNKELADWNANYLRNMAEASKIKAQHKAVAQAKKNAEYWLWGSGIGNIGRRLGDGPAGNPFEMFYGDQLFEALTGGSLSRGTKRDHDSGIDEETQADSRRVRARTEEEVGRGPGEEDTVLPAFEDEDPGVELAREAPSALDDQQLFSAMPWNMSASARGSSIAAGKPSSLAGPPSRGRHSSRLVTESPLVGRGRAGGLEALRSLEGDDEYGSIGPEDYGMAAGADTSDDLYAEPEPLSPHATQHSIRVREALSAEGGNFLAFISDAIVEKRERLRAAFEQQGDILMAETANDTNDVTFEDILPPNDTHTVVAAQGLMMVLALGTRGLLEVTQDEPFGEINLSLTEKGISHDSVRERGGYGGNVLPEGAVMQEEDERMEEDPEGVEEVFEAIEDYPAPGEGTQEGGGEPISHDDLYDP